MQVTITEPLCLKQHKTKRAAAYARVSTKKEEQLHSLEAQTSYFEFALRKNPDYLFVGIYADRGVSGTTDERPGFQRLLEDCRKGLIDVVITKSITRFARNTEVILSSVRELTNLGIDVYFEKENLHTLGKSELELTLRAQYAEEEIRSMSLNQKMKIRAKFKEGIPSDGRMLGYRLERGVLVIKEDEVEAVKLIFNSYLDGMGTSAIAKLMNAKGYKTINGGSWSIPTIQKIIRNEKYAGDMLLQKTYHKGHRSQNSRRNKGELPMYLVEESHEPIIPREMFEEVQKEIARRAQIHRKIRESIPEEKHLFAGLITCGKCGCKYVYFRNANRKEPNLKPKWWCNKSRTNGQEFCSAKAVPEEILIQQTKRVLEKVNLIKTDEPSFKEQIPAYLEKYVDGITVSGDRELTFVLKDGSAHIVKWEYKSRAKSWTPEMKQKARERQLAIWAERKVKEMEAEND